MSSFPPSLLPRHPAAEAHSNFNLHQAMQNLYGTMQSTTRTIATNYSYLIALAIGLAAVATVTITAFSLSTITIVNDNGYYYPTTRQLAAALLTDDAPLLIEPPEVLLACGPGRANLCTYFNYVNNSLIAFAAFINNGTVENDTLLALPYSNSAPFMYNVTNAKLALDNLVGEDLLQNGQIATLQGQTSRLLTTKNRNLYVSATYGSDGSGDGSASLPFASLYRAMQAVPNITSQFSQYSILFDNGLYTESNFIAFKPNVILSGNEIGTLLIFSAGAGLDGGAWIATGTGYVSFLRFGLIRCSTACAFNMATAAPATSIFSVFRFYNSTFDLTSAALSFQRRADANSYFAVTMESTTVTGTTVTFQDMTSVAWSTTGDCFSAISASYSTAVTYASGVPTVTYNGLVAHGNVAITNSVSGLTVDVSLMDVVMRDAATLSRNSAGGAFINVHGDVLSLGAINSGLNSVGGGSTEYLTNAPGLGYTPTTPSDWSPAPTTQQAADDQLASRVKAVESTGISWSLLNRGIYPSGTISPAIGVPSGAFEVTFEIIGGGGGGSPGNSGVNAGCGGGAAARTTITVPVTSSSTFDGYIGAGGGPSSNGEASFICVTTGGSSDCYYAGGGGGAQTGVSDCTPGAGGSNDPFTGTASLNLPGTPDTDTNAFAGATAGIAGCAANGINGQTTGDFGSGAAGGCAGFIGGKTYGGIPPPPIVTNPVFSGGNGAAGWANEPGLGGPDAIFLSCAGSAAGDGGGGGGGGAKLLGFDPCPGGSSPGGSGGSGIVWYQFHIF